MSWLTERFASIFTGSNEQVRETLQEIRETDQGELLYGVQYTPEEDELLYHYCDANAFQSIVQNKELWFSDVFAMNDFSEMHWGYGVWESAASQMAGELSREFVDRIDKRIHETSKFFLPLICCFSKDGDVLSQWRAYAQDGHGFAIGFSASELGQLPARALRVVYEKQPQIDFAKNWLKSIHEVEASEGFTFGTDFHRAVSFFAMDLCALKNPGFREELEVRYVHSLNIVEENGSRKFRDNGGVAFGNVAPGRDVSFRMRDSVPVAYIKQDFYNGGDCNAIKRVVLGPKNLSRETGISLFLETSGIKGVEVVRSETSYG